MTPRKAIALEAIGDFWREAAVLVAVFGLLDRMTRHEDLTLSWGVGALASALGLLALGIGVRIWSRS
jgi:hypothetical protein